MVERDDAGEWLGSDALVARMRRHLATVRAALAAAAAAGLDGPGGAEAAARRYLRFLRRLRRGGGGGGRRRRMEPAADVDAVWHAHMQAPARYAADCLRIAGGLVQHTATPVAEAC